MKSKLLLILAIFSLNGFLFADNTEIDKIMWKNAYLGDFSIVHKLMLTREKQSFNDGLLDQFVMAYVNYRLANSEQIENIFKGVDAYLEYHLFSE